MAASALAPDVLKCKGAGRVPDFSSLRVVASDMDGTFLDASHEAPAANLAAVREAEALGLHVIFCTGRNRASAQAKLPSVDLSSRPGVFLNGAVVYGATGAVIHERTVAGDVVVDVLRFIREQSGRFSAVLCRGDDHFVPDLAEKWALHLHSDYDDPKPFGMGGYDEAISGFSSNGAAGEPPEKRSRKQEPHLLHVVGSREDLDLIRGRLEKLIAGRVRLARALPTCLTLLHPLSNKADGLAPALQEFGSTYGQTIAFGDAENDVEMLKAVRMGVAMGNAMDGVKEAAAWQCASNVAEPPGVAGVLHLVIDFFRKASREPCKDEQ